MSHYTMNGTGYRFETRKLAEKYKRNWPGYLGSVYTVEPDYYNPPVHDICDNPRNSADLILYVENYSIPIRYV